MVRVLTTDEYANIIKLLETKDLLNWDLALQLLIGIVGKESADYLMIKECYYLINPVSKPVDYGGTIKPAPWLRAQLNSANVVTHNGRLTQAQLKTWFNSIYIQKDNWRTQAVLFLKHNCNWNGKDNNQRNK